MYEKTFIKGKLYMKDILDNSLEIGNRVIYIKHAASNPKLAIGTITNIYKSDKECSVDGYSHVTSLRIMKLC